MDTDKFDVLTKMLATGGSRRRLVKRAAGSALAGALGVVGVNSVGATHKRKHRCTPSRNHSCEGSGSQASCKDQTIGCATFRGSLGSLDTYPMCFEFPCCTPCSATRDQLNKECQRKYDNKQAFATYLC